MKHMHAHSTLSFALAAMLAAASAAAEESAPEIFGDWAYSCVDSVCQIHSALANAETRKTTVAISVVRDARSGDVNAIVRAPLNVALQPGLQLFAEKGKPLRAPYQVCNEEGCTAVVPLAPEAIEAFEASDALAVDVVRYGASTPSRATMSLDGFGRAMQALRKTE